jgi:hypothetical protein
MTLAQVFGGKQQKCCLKHGASDESDKPKKIKPHVSMGG